MGTSGSYSGSGGRWGSQVRRELKVWLDNLPSAEPSPGELDVNDGDSPNPPENAFVHLAPDIYRNVMPFFKSRSAPGSGGGGGGAGGAGGPDRPPTDQPRGRHSGGPQRSLARSAGVAGRAAAAALAFQSGDAVELASLGLDFDELTGLSNPLEVTRRIVAAACESVSDSTIEDQEQRYVAAQIAEWIFDQRDDPPNPDEIVRKSMALIMFETLSSETGELMREGGRPAFVSELGERELRDAADIISQRAVFSSPGVSSAELSNAIEAGIETLRTILRGHH